MLHSKLFRAGVLLTAAFVLLGAGIEFTLGVAGPERRATGSGGVLPPVLTN